MLKSDHTKFSNKIHLIHSKTECKSYKKFNRPPAKSKFGKIQHNDLETNAKFIRRKSQKIKTLGPGSNPAV